MSLEDSLSKLKSEALQRLKLSQNRLDNHIRQTRAKLPTVWARDTMTRRLALEARIMATSAIAAVLDANVRVYGQDLVELHVHQALFALVEGAHLQAARRLLLASSEVLDEDRILDLGEAHLAMLGHKSVAICLAKIYRQRGDILRPLELLDTYAARSKSSALYRRVSNDALLLDAGMPVDSQGQREWQPANPRRILYHVNQCMPHHNSGYAIRTHWLAKHLKLKGWEIDVFARYGYPNDRNDYQAHALVNEREGIEGVNYHFAPCRKGFRTLRPQAYHERAIDTVLAQARQHRPALIHTATNQIVGLAGTEAASRLGLPSVYEVRGLWHLTRASERPEYMDSEHYRMTHALEIQAARQADHVLAITGAIRDILLDAGIGAEKITVVPNSVDTSLFQPTEPHAELKAELGIGDETIIGFIGSFGDYEGLRDLVRAAEKLLANGRTDTKFLLVGDGASMDGVVALTRELGLESSVLLPGRVPHDRVREYYSLIDIAAYPRQGARVCEVVSPLKPYEAMAMGKAVVVSSVQALAEMVQDETTGLIHQKDDVASLAACLERLLDSPSERETLGQNARQWVAKHRSWQATTETIEDVYRRLIA